MKRIPLLLLVILLAALAACSTQDPVVSEPSPTVGVETAPTEAAAPAEPSPQPAPTDEPAPQIVVDPQLIDTLWVWTSRDAAEPLDLTQSADPHNYNLLFNADGTFFAGLDCNRGTGTYQTPGDGTIAFQLGATTMALCPEGSHDDQMIAMLSSAASYAFEAEGDVVAFTMADGAVDRYSRADTVAGALPTIDDLDEALIDRVWQWTARDNDPVAAPEDYSLTFNDDGTFYARLDCNNGGGTYTVADGTLTLTLLRTTRALCDQGSRAAEMAAAFEQPLSYAVSGQTLTLTQADGTADTYVDANPSLVGTTWQWLGTMTGEGPMEVADSSRYTIDFLDDGTAAIKADCNQVVADFTAEDGALTITPGPATLAACPEDTQGETFVQQLSAAALYFFRDGDLYIDQFADSGTIRLGPLPLYDLPEPESGEPTGTVNAPDGINLRSGPGTNFPTLGTAAQGDSGTLIGISEDGEWYVVRAPGFPDNRVWVAAAFVDAVNADGLPVIPSPPAPSALVGPTWQWAGTTTPTGDIAVADPSRYTIDFFADGTAGIGADCNRVTATWTSDGRTVAITPGASTLAACPADSQGQEFVQQLGNAAIYFFQGGELFIDQAISSGTMRFVTGVTPPQTAAPGEGATGTVQTFRVVSFGPAGAEQPPLADTALTVTLDADAGTISGNAGCNTFSGTLNTADGAFAIGPLATTAMACDDDVTEQETAFLAALAGATGFQWAIQPGDVVNGQITYTTADTASGVITIVSP